MPLSSTEPPPNPQSPTALCQGSFRSLLSPGNSPVVSSNNQSTIEQPEEQGSRDVLLPSSSSATTSGPAPSYSTMAAKTVANIKRLQVRKLNFLSFVWKIQDFFNIFSIILGFMGPVPQL